MTRPAHRAFTHPDQVIELGLVRQEIIELGDLVVARVTHQPGWRWSTHVRPSVGTETCSTRHLGVVLSGVMGVRYQDGRELEIPAGSVFDVPPGHDGWVIGDEPLVTVDWGGARDWLTNLSVNRSLATLLLTDIVASTEHARRIGDRAWRDLLAAHNEALRDEIYRARGQEVATTGDGLLALFPGPARAVAAAVAIRRRVAALGLEIRQGIHVGEVDRVDWDVRGIAVHETARIAALAAPGEILLSDIARSLATGLSIATESRGHHELRGTGATRELFAVLA